MTQIYQKKLRKKSKIKGHKSSIERDYNGYKLQTNKQFVEEILLERGMKTTIQILCDKRLIIFYINSDEALKICLFIEKRRSCLEELNDDTIQGFCS